MNFTPHRQLSSEQNKKLEAIIRKAKSKCGASIYQMRLFLDNETTAYITFRGGWLPIPIDITLRWNESQNVWGS